ncbi:Por secretion system C-terminal sorting domain-containing protein [Psychroflexus salarius]|uniref:Por secretion system C-terminal sorting domain-containing protein n=1 Tax=Psychroflexus salarius TaxID=1155689 RepID=A0A1M4UWD7_9FLAO|nr:T9SS type A sorting domain-containing protein [Psychroflexus salarius]SHE61081.1 Por secretion system C-terminal sorting domain-containing protein [Psychroflexus salarius]
MKHLLLLLSLIVSFYGFSQTTYSGNGNSGFAGPIGGSTLEFDDDGTTITGTFTKGAGDFNDVMVIYISTGASGRSIIDADVNDQNDDNRRAISSAGVDASDINFPSGFEATHAIGVYSNVFGGLYSIPATGTIGNNGLTYLSPVGQPLTPSDASFTFSFDWSEIGLTSSDSFEFIVVYMNGGNGFLSDEAYGDGIASGNPGSANVTFTSFRNYPFYYVYDNSWTPSNPDGVTQTAKDVMVKTGSTSLTSDTSLRSITIESGASLDIENSVLTLSGDIDNNGTFTFKSNGTSTAQLANFTGSITGDITVERFIPAKRAFRLLSSSVGGQTFANAWQQDTHITGSGGVTNGFDATSTDNPSLFTFDNSLDPQVVGGEPQSWQAVTSTSDVISAGTPYRLMVRGDRTIDLTNNEASATATTLSASGTMHTGSYSPTLASAADNYSFVGNPYQAVVDFASVTKSNLTDFIYVWDASVAGSNGNGGYVTVQVSTGNITAPSPSSSDASQYIAPGQAFFVQNNATGNGSITFEEADKATGQTQVGIFSTYTNFYINSRLYKASALQNGEMESDAIGLRFNENYTTIGSDEDASKLANPGENYAIVNNGFKSIDKQNIPTDGHQIDLLMMNYEDTAYSLTFNLGNQPETLKVYLNDNYLNTQTELTESTTYDFTVDANVPESIDQNRFHLSFEEVPLNNQNFDAGQVRLYPNPVVNQLQIELPASVEINSVQVFNTLGQEVLTTTQSQVDVSRLASGVYVVELETSAGKVSKKIIKK